ncbi:MAG: alkaline phosphatase D family protein [Burkholderiales bacterium]|nr:alkaline phosphatase D family protein [Burkholderiales bacterium]
MSEVTSRREFLLKAAAAIAAGSSVVACGGSDDDDSTPVIPAVPAQFTYGVASGDPLSDRVMLWTYAKVADSTAAVPLTWQVATDSSFTTVVNSGAVDALPANGFTAKVDATGLTPGATYFYRFRDAAGTTSTVGTTRTLPAAAVASVKFAVFSCSLYSEGYFNAYADAAKSDALYALHLGDYIYEYGSDATKYGNKDAVALGRVASPANDIVSLADYRQRYAQYKADADLQALHAKMPWITIWDDHEFANNAYVGGAENHNPATQGDWATRKAMAAKAYHEWLPIRSPDPVNLLKIYRHFDFGKLLSLHMLDTRIEGRDRQYDNFGDADGGIGRYITGLTPVGGVMPDASRHMMSTEQQSWLTTGLTTSSATWQFLGNQDIMARMWFPASVLQVQAKAAATPPTATLADVSAAITDYLTAKATRAAAGTGALTPAQAALLNPALNPTLPYNLDAWDGYPAQRDAILSTVKSLNKNLVVLSGDSHNGWFTQLTTLAGVKVGVEFAGSSVTSTGFEAVGLGELASSLDGSALVPQLGAAAIGAGLGLVDDLGYADTKRRGYLRMTVTAASVKGEYVFVDTVKSKTYTASVGKTITVASSGAVTYA